MSIKSDLSWFAGICQDCRFNVVVTQPYSGEIIYDYLTAKKLGVNTMSDYWWYCSNKECKNHIVATHTGDMEHPDWVDLS